MIKHIAIYARVSTSHQDTALQETELSKWLEVNGNGTPIEWYRDKATGKTMDRPGWQRLEGAISSRRVSAIVIWRLDRLGRTASGLTNLFDTLSNEGVNLISLKDSLDLATAAGRLMANVLASVANTRPRCGVSVCGQASSEPRPTVSAGADRILAGPQRRTRRRPKWCSH
jgi:DNA invertase Pin-like site-specific DNA recombinase